MSQENKERQEEIIAMVADFSDKVLSSKLKLVKTRKALEDWVNKDLEKGFKLAMEYSAAVAALKITKEDKEVVEKADSLLKGLYIREAKGVAQLTEGIAVCARVVSNLATPIPADE